MAVILTIASQPTTFASGSWPQSTFNTGGWKFTFTETAAAPGGLRCLFSLTPSGVGGVWLNGGSIEIYSDADALLATRAITKSAAQAVTVTIDRVAGTMTVAGATTGNGSVSISAGNIFGAGTLCVGANAGTSPFSGTISSVEDLATGSDLTPPVLASSPQLPAPSVMTEGTVYPGALTSSPTLPAPTVDSILVAGFGAAGTIAYSATNPAPGYPTGITAGQYLLLAVGTKPDTVTIGTPSGWTLIANYSGGGGTTGVDAGPTRIQVFGKVATGSETGTLTVTGNSQSVSWAQIFRTTTTLPAWSVAACGGTDATTGTAWSVTCDADPGIQAGDLCVVFSCIPTDVGAGAQFSAESVSATGITWGAFTEASEPFSSTGQDIGGFTFYGTATAGTSSAAPVVTATAGGTTTNARGPTAIVRLRGVNVAVTPGTLTSSPQLPAPAISSDGAAITPPALTSSPALNGPALGIALAAPALASSPTLPAPSVSDGSAPTLTAYGPTNYPAYPSGQGLHTNFWAHGAPMVVRDRDYGEIVCPVRSENGNMYLAVSTNRGSSFSFIGHTGGGADPLSGQDILSCVQDSSGRYHLLTQSIGSGQCYTRFVLDRDGSHAVTGYTRQASALAVFGGNRSEHVGALTIAKNQNGTDCLVVATSSADFTAGTWTVAATKTASLTPTSAADFTKLDGTSGWTVIYSDTTTAGQGHEHAVWPMYLASSGELVFVRSHVPAEGYKSGAPYTNVYTLRCAQSGATTWSTGTWQANAAGQGVQVRSVAAASDRLWLLVGYQTDGLCVDSFSATGVYTHDAISRPGTVDTQYQFDGAIACSADSSKVWYWAACYSTSAAFGSFGVYTGGAWTKSATTAQFSNYAASTSTGDDNGIYVVTADGTYGATTPAIGAYYLTGASSALTPPALASSPSLPAPTLAVAAAPAALTSAPTLQSPTVGVTIAPGALTSATALPAPVVDVSVAPASLTSSPQLPAPSVDTSIAPVAISSTPTLPAPTLAVTLSAPTLTSAPSVPAPGVTSALLAPVLASSPALPAPTVSSVGQVSPAPLTSSPSLLAPSIDVALTAPLLASSPALPAPTVGSALAAPALASAPALPAPTVSQATGVAPPVLASSPALPAPALSAALSPPTLASVPSLPAPSVSQPLDSTLSPPTLTAVVYLVPPSLNGFAPADDGYGAHVGVFGVSLGSRMRVASRGRRRG